VVVRARLDKKGISAENGVPALYQRREERSFLPEPQDSTTGYITGNQERDISIRASGLRTRYDYLRIQRYYAPTKAMRTCSKYTIQSLVKTDDIGEYVLVKEKGQKTRRKHYLEEPAPDMELRVNEYGSSISGMQTCDNPYCVMCARSRTMERAESMARVLQYTRARHWSRYFVTLTIQRQPDARKAVEDIQKRWRTVQKALQYTYGKKLGIRLEFARAVDVTFKPELLKAGQCYHVHLHCIILLEASKLHAWTDSNGERQTSGVIRETDLRDRIVKAWKAGGDYGIQVSEQGQDVQEIRDSEKIAKYIGKMSGLGLELASSQTKKGKGGSISLPQMLERIQDGETNLVRLYEEFLTSMRGVRTMSFSQGWKKLEEASQAEAGEESEFQGSRWVVPPEWWAPIISQQSRTVQALYYWTQRAEEEARNRQSSLLESLLRTPIPPEYKPDYLEKWIRGELRAWHLECFVSCQ